MISLRVPNFSKVLASAKRGLERRASELARDDIEVRTSLMRSGLDPSGQPQKANSRPGKVPLVKTGKLSSRAGWILRESGGRLSVRPSSDRVDAVRDLSEAGYRIVQVATATKDSARQKIAEVILEVSR